jgi:hypothetical protein
MSTTSSYPNNSYPLQPTMIRRNSIVFFVAAFPTLMCAQYDTLVLTQPSDFRGLRQRPVPKRLVVNTFSDEIPFRKLQRAVQDWGEVAEIIFEGNGFEAYPSWLLPMNCRIVRFGEQDWPDLEEAVDAALASNFSKHIQFRIEEFDGLDHRVRKASNVDSLTVMTAAWEECKKAENPCSATSYLHVTVQADGTQLRQIPLMLYHREAPVVGYTVDEVEVLSAPCKKYVSVAPPIEGVEVPQQLYSMNASEGATVEAASGSVIKVPSDAFVDENGQRVSGNVTLAYREFRTPADLVMSGIPMSSADTDSAGAWYFESGGMLEITAFQGQQELSMADGKSISIVFSSTSDSPAMELFRFEDAANEWIVTGPAPLQDTGQPDAAVSPAYYAYLSALQLQLRGLPDTSGLAHRFSSFDYIHQWHASDRRSGMRAKSRSTTLSNHIRLVSVRKNRELGTHFQLTSAFSTTKLNPELRAFQRVRFCVGHDMSAKELRKRFYYKKNPINDVRIYKHGDEVQLLRWCGL